MIRRLCAVLFFIALAYSFRGRSNVQVHRKQDQDRPPVPSPTPQPKAVKSRKWGVLFLLLLGETILAASALVLLIDLRQASPTLRAIQLLEAKQHIFARYPNIRTHNRDGSIERQVYNLEEFKLIMALIRANYKGEQFDFAQPTFIAVLKPKIASKPEMAYDIVSKDYFEAAGLDLPGTYVFVGWREWYTPAHESRVICTLSELYGWESSTRTNTLNTTSLILLAIGFLVIVFGTVLNESR